MQGWTIARLGDVASKIQIGPFGSLLHKEDYTDFGVPLVNPMHIVDGRIRADTRHAVSMSSLKRLNGYRLKEGDVVLGRRGEMGRCAVVTHDTDGYLCGTGSLFVRTDPKVLDPSYLQRLLSSDPVVKKLERASIGTTMANLNQGIVADLELPIPPLEEQWRIADILDRADALRAKRREALALLNDFTQSVFVDIFGDPLANPKGWPAAALGAVCSKVTDGTHHSPRIEPEGVPYLTAKHIRPGAIDFHADPWFISERDHREIFARCDPRKGDVLYIKDGATTGAAAINDYDFEFSMLSSVALLRPDPGVLSSDYLVAWLNNATVKAQMISDMGGAAIRRLTLAKIKRSRILVPDASDQRRFSEIIGAVSANRSFQKRNMIAMDSLFASLQQRAFAGSL